MEQNLTDCTACSTGDCWYCERGGGTRLAADNQELPVCCCGRVFITPSGWRERTTESGDRR